MAQRGRPRKSMEEHLASGAIFKNPGRFKHRLHELRGGKGKLKPSEHLCRSRAKLEIWNDLVAASDGHALPSDKYFLEQVVSAIEAARYDVRPAVRKLAADLTGEWDERIRRRSEASNTGVPAAGGFGEFI